MPKLAANLSMLFTELDFPGRFKAAAEAGFKGVEYLFPYDYDKTELARQLKTYGLTQALHNMPAGNWAKGERGIACHPDRVDEFKAGVGQAISYATALGCGRVNCLAGIAPAGVEAERIRDTFVQNLSYAADRLKNEGIRLVIEPLNTFDTPGFYLNHTEQAVDIIEKSGSDNLFVQYDIYHAQRMEGELAATLEKHLARIGHIQLADNPGRHEPGTGEINFPWLLNHIDNIGYDGWIGCEYRPAGNTQDGLGWIRDARIKQQATTPIFNLEK